MLSHIWGIFSSFFSFFSAPPLPPASRPISQPGGPYPSLEAQIPVLRLKSHPQGQNLNPKAQIPLSRDLGLKTALLPLNFNHNLLKQGTGTADHLTLLRLFFFSATSSFSSTLFLSLKVWNFDEPADVRDIYTNNVAEIGTRYGKMESTDIKEEEGYSTMFFIAQLGGQAVCD